MDDVKCRLCLFKTEQDESVNLFTPGKNNELISDTVMSFVPIELTRDDNLPQVICKVCVQKLNSIIEFRMIILNSDAQLKSQKTVVSRLREALSVAIKRPQKLVQKSESQVCGDSANCGSEESKLDIDDVKLETEIKIEPDDTIKEQNSEGTASKGGARHRGYKSQSLLCTIESILEKCLFTVTSVIKGLQRNLLWFTIEESIQMNDPLSVMSAQKRSSFSSV
jgi:hypothetical protein